MSYRGIHIDFPCGRGGLNANHNTLQIPLTDLQLARNIRFDGLTWRKAGGLQEFDDDPISGTPTCYGGFDWHYDSGNQNQVTVWDNGNVYLESGGDIDATTLDTGWTLSNPVTFCEGGNVAAGDDKELYIVSKGNTPKKLVGNDTSLSSFTSESPDWSANKPGAAIAHDFRTLAFDVDGAPHNFYVSSLSDKSAFNADDSRVFQIAPGIGNGLKAAISYLPTTVCFFKYPRGIWYVDTTDLTGFYLPTQLIRDDIGICGPNALAKVGSDVIFVSPNGRLYSLQALRPDVDPVEADITARLYLGDFIRDNVDATKLKFARLLYDELRKELWYFFTRQGSAGTNDMALVFDISELQQGQSIIKTATDDRGEFFQAAWKRIGSDGFNEILVAGAGGLVYEANSITRAVGDDEYVSEFQTPDTDCKELGPEIARKDKLFHMLELYLLPTGNYDMSFDIIVDGISVKTVTVNVGSSGAVFDDALFDTDAFGGSLIIKKKVPIEVIGNQISLRGYNSTAGEDFAIAHMRVYLEPQNDTYEM